VKYRLRPIALAALTCLLVWLLAACGGGENVPFAANEQARIECTDECAAHGQCGTLTSNDQPAVLANEGGPAVTLQNRFFLEDSVVTVVESSQRELIAAEGGVPLLGVATQFPHMFYLVSGEGKTAWVSEWCLGRP
jgi:hypothetical protein